MTWEDSLAVISWWDGSLTRLWSNTKISIEQNKISKDYTDINISFELLTWKSWSQVISFISKDSSFTQHFDGIEAWVRGTTFDVDLEKQYLRVVNHAVTLQDENWNIINITEGKILNISDFSFIELSRYIAELKDSLWDDVNTQLDLQNLEVVKDKLKAQINNRRLFLFLLDFLSPKYRIVNLLNTNDTYDDIEEKLQNLSQNNRQEVYRYILSKYQDFHSIEANDYDFYKRKLWYKKALLDINPSDENAENLMRTTLYDIQDISESQVYIWAWETLEILLQHKDLLQKIDIPELENSLQSLPLDIRNKFIWSISSLESTINSLWNAWVNQAWEILNQADDTIKDFLDSSVWGVLDGFKK